MVVLSFPLTLCACSVFVLKLHVTPSVCEELCYTSCVDIFLTDNQL